MQPGTDHQKQQSAITQRIESFAGWHQTIGHINMTLYPPNVPADAMHGSPMNRHHWSVVYWYPGKQTWLCVFPDRVAALVEIQKTNPVPSDNLNAERHNIITIAKEGLDLKDGNIGDKEK